MIIARVLVDEPSPIHIQISLTEVSAFKKGYKNWEWNMVEGCGRNWMEEVKGRCDQRALCAYMDYSNNKHTFRKTNDVIPPQLKSSAIIKPMFG